jgi:hypothetical protein
VSDVIYVLLTVVVFVLLSLLVGFLDRHSGASTDPGTAPASEDDLVADRGAL